MNYVMNNMHLQNAWVSKKTFCVMAAAALMLMGGRRPSAIHQVPPSDAEKLIRDVGVVLLDVRTKEEFAQGHIPGAQSIPINELEQRLRELPADKTQPILVYCRDSVRSSKAAQLLLRAGRKDIYNLSGGVRAWAAAQKPIQISPKP